MDSVFDERGLKNDPQHHQQIVTQTINNPSAASS